MHLIVHNLPEPLPTLDLIGVAHICTLDKGNGRAVTVRGPISHRLDLLNDNSEIVTVNMNRRTFPSLLNRESFLSEEYIHESVS
jgi:hypothetical protein